MNPPGMVPPQDLARALALARSTLQRLAQAGSAWQISRTGIVTEAAGITLRATGLPLSIGDLCEVDRDGLAPLRAEVVGVHTGTTVLMPFGDLGGVQAGARVRRLGATHRVGVSAGMLGRIVDAFGQPLDERGEVPVDHQVALRRAAPPALSRQPVAQAVPTGVRVIDALATVGRGQRIGVFAPAGAGKTSLLGMLARHADFDVNVIGLIGERGRELGEFIDQVLGEQGLARSVVVVSTSDASAMERAKAAELATALAEYFRDEFGQNVLLMMDSVTRYARALREIGLAAGEPPARRGYPASVFAELPKLLERAGNGAVGSITAVYTVLMEDEESADPIAEEVRSILDGHLTLTRKIAGQGRYPAVDVARSLSRVMRQVASPAHNRAADRLRALMAKQQEVELLVQVGEYQRGSDPLADQALDRHAAIQQFLGQGMHEASDFDQVLAELARLAGEPPPGS